MPHVTACAVTSCVHCMVHACRQAGCPYVNVAQQKLLMNMPNTKIANQNVLKMILIAMHNENKADCNENFKICAEESVGPLYRQ